MPNSSKRPPAPSPDALAEMRRQRQAEHARRVAELQIALEPLARDIQSLGIQKLSQLQTGVDTKRAPYPSAIPVLLDHLRRDYPPAVRVFIATCLQAPEAKVGWDTIVAQYEKEPKSLAKDQLANVLAAVAGDEHAGEICRLVRNVDNGPSRLLLLRALVRLRDPQAKITLREMKDDPELTKEIEVILEKLDRRKH